MSKRKFVRLLGSLAIVIQFQPLAKMEQREGTMLAEASEVTSNISIRVKADENSLPLEWGKEGYMLSVTVDSFIDANYVVTRGFVCNSERDIKCVNGLCGDSEHYWSIELNGDSQHTSLTSLVKPGDELELVYKKKTEIDHQRLKDWLLSSSKGR